MRRVLLTPHVAGLTPERRAGLTGAMLDELERHLNGLPLRHEVTVDELEQHGVAPRDAPVPRILLSSKTCEAPRGSADKPQCPPRLDELGGPPSRTRRWAYAPI